MTATILHYPIRLSFAMTIKKAQGQNIANVGIYLPEPVISHNQLYVALSRDVSQKTTWYWLSLIRISTLLEKELRILFIGMYWKH
jgi:hypothetical protein